MEIAWTILFLRLLLPVILMKKIVHKNLQLNLIFLIFEFTLIEHMSVRTGKDVKRLETQKL